MLCEWGFFTGFFFQCPAVWGCHLLHCNTMREGEKKRNHKIAAAKTTKAPHSGRITACQWFFSFLFLWEKNQLFHKIIQLKCKGCLVIMTTEIEITENFLQRKWKPCLKNLLSTHVKFAVTVFTNLIFLKAWFYSNIYNTINFCSLLGFFHIYLNINIVSIVNSC